MRQRAQACSHHEHIRTPTRQSCLQREGKANQGPATIHLQTGLLPQPGDFPPVLYTRTNVLIGACQPGCQSRFLFETTTADASPTCFNKATHGIGGSCSVLLRNGERLRASSRGAFCRLADKVCGPGVARRLHTSHRMSSVKRGSIIQSRPDNIITRRNPSCNPRNEERAQPLTQGASNAGPRRRSDLSSANQQGINTIREGLR